MNNTLVPSQFIITSKLDDEKIILYNTLTTALITLQEQDYDLIFTKRIFTNSAIVEKLSQMSFLIKNSDEEHNFLDRLREKDMNTTSQVVTIFSTNKCNARCYYCFEKGIIQSEMSKQTAMETIEFITRFYPEKKMQIMWFGGEPLYNFNIIELITKKLVGKGYELVTHITTNGSLLTPKQIDFFKKYYSQVSFQVTIDDINEEYYKIKKYVDFTAENAFRTVIENCRMILNNGLYLSIRINYLKTKIDKAILVFAYIKDLFSAYDSELLRIYLAAITLSEDYNDCLPIHLKGREHPLLRYAEFQHREDINSNRIAKSKLLHTFCLMPKLSVCGAVRKKHIAIDADGNIYKCQRFAKYDEYIIGNVRDGIDYNNEHYKFFIDQKIRDPECRQCNILPLCQGGCKAIRLLYDKKMECEIKDVQSDLVRSYYEVLTNEK